MAELLGYPLHSFIHLPLLCNAQGQRLSKRDKSLDMEALRADFTAEEIIGRLAFLTGLKPDDAPCRPEELLPLFSWNKVPCNDIAVNP